MMSKSETAEWNRGGNCDTRPWGIPVYWEGADMKESPPLPYRHARTVILSIAQAQARARGETDLDLYDCHGTHRGSFSTDSIYQRKGA